MLQDVLNYAVFACSGALAGVSKAFDLWGILSMDAATGVGVGAVFATGLRLASLQWKWKLPMAPQRVFGRSQ